MRQKTDKELKQLALRFCKGEIFTSLQIREHDMHLLHNIFMPLVFVDSKDLSPDIGMLYGNLHDGTMSSMSINGYPIFGSCSFINIDDTKFFVEQTKIIQKTLDSLVADEIPDIL
jgi:hypothetical protein